MHYNDREHQYYYLSDVIVIGNSTVMQNQNQNLSESVKGSNLPSLQN